MKKIDLENFRSFANTLDGQSFVTLHRKAPFNVHLLPLGLQYTPVSSGKPRIQEWKYIDQVISRFGETGSFHPRDYHDITMNASYVLTVIKKYLQMDDVLFATS